MVLSHYYNVCGVLGQGKPNWIFYYGETIKGPCLSFTYFVFYFKSHDYKATTIYVECEIHHKVPTLDIRELSVHMLGQGK